MEDNLIYKPGLPEKEYSFFESMTALGLIIISFVFVRLFSIIFMGNITIVFNLGVMALDITYLSFKKYKIRTSHCILFCLAVLFNIGFLISSNTDIRLLSGAFSVLLTTYTVFIIICGRKPFPDEFPLEMTEAVFKQPFGNFTELGSALKHPLKKNNAAVLMKNIAAGLVIALPCTFIVGSLLMNADNMFSDIIENILPEDSGEIILILFQAGFSVIFACYLFGVMRTDAGKVRLNPKLNKKGISAVTLYSAVTPVCILYIIFFFVSLNYFISAFSGVLPEGYSYAEYARRGFFELSAVSAINLCIISGLNLFCPRSDGRKPGGIKFFTVFIIVSSLVLIVTALSKMVMYIGENGLTHLRVYTSWFMVLLFILFIFILVKTYKPDYKMYIWMFVAFVIMLSGLCFSNIDYRIAGYNIKGYLNGSISRLDIYHMSVELSDAAVIAAIPYADNEIIGDKIREYLEYEYRNPERNNDFHSFSLESALAEELLEEYAGKQNIAR